MESNNKEPRGIGGLLIVPAIGLLLSDVVFALALYGDLARVNAERSSGVFVIHAFCELALFSFTLFVTWKFFTKDRHLPTLCISLLVVGLAYRILLLVLSYLSPAVYHSAGYARLFFAFFSALLWGSYFSNSKRVANTFTRPSKSEQSDGPSDVFK